MEAEDLSFKIVKVDGAHDEVIARIGNLLISRAAFDKALFVYPQDHLELRQGAAAAWLPEQLACRVKSPPP